MLFMDTYLYVIRVEQINTEFKSAINSGQTPGGREIQLRKRTQRPHLYLQLKNKSDSNIVKYEDAISRELSTLPFILKLCVLFYILKLFIRKEKCFDSMKCDQLC